MLYTVIMAGGAGTRFWPASRRDRPKQLLDLAGPETMIQATVGRLGELVAPDRVLVVTNQRLVEPIRAQLPELPAGSVVGEPCKRDTAPCIGLAAGLVRRLDPDATMAVMPADHVIEPASAFQQAIRHAERLVDEDPRRIITFGIKPSYPAESFGYIERTGTPLQPEGSGPSTFAVKQFREKPKTEVARQYLESGEFYWNSGIFLWRASTILEALQRFEPKMSEHLETIFAGLETDQSAEILEREFSAIQGKSIDFAVMEHYEHVLVVEAPFQWDDVGSWQSLSRMHEPDAQSNTVIGRHLGIDTNDCIIRSQDGHLIVTIGMQECVVVHTPDATLVANKRDEERVREVVKRLEEVDWREYL